LPKRLFLRQMTPLGKSRDISVKILFNIFVSIPTSFKWSLSFRFPHQNPLYISLPSRAFYIPRPSHLYLIFLIGYDEEEHIDDPKRVGLFIFLLFCTSSF